MSTNRYQYLVKRVLHPSSARAAIEYENVFQWHWHPASKRSDFREPHFHMPKSAPYGRFHVPTGRVTFEDVALFCMDSFDVVPVRNDARKVIEKHRDTHKTWRSWH